MKLTNKKMSQEDINKMIEAFNLDFKTKIKNNNMAFLADIFNNFVTIDWSEVEGGNKQIEEMAKIESQLLDKLDIKEQELLNRWSKLQDDYNLTVTEQAFIYGVCFAIQFGNETRLLGGNNNE